MCIGVQAKVSVNYYFVANFLFLHICCRPSGTSIWYNDKRLEADSSTHRLQVSFSLPQQVTWTAIPSPSCAADWKLHWWVGNQLCWELLWWYGAPATAELSGHWGWRVYCASCSIHLFISQV